MKPPCKTGGGPSEISTQKGGVFENFENDNITLLTQSSKSLLGKYVDFLETCCLFQQNYDFFSLHSVKYLINDKGEW